jgi:hypothetical protein
LNQWGAKFGNPAIFVSLVEWADRIIVEWGQASRGRQGPFTLYNPFYQMFIIYSIVYIAAILGQENTGMATGRVRSHKHFRLDAAKIKRAQKVLRASTETEAIERALDLVISEHQRNRMAAEANQRFIESGIEIKDIYGVLDK